jgi:hypothetical protein
MVRSPHAPFSSHSASDKLCVVRPASLNPRFTALVAMIKAHPELGLRYRDALADTDVRGTDALDQLEP